MKRLIFLVLAIHTFVIFLVFWSDISNPGEDWSWMAAFFLDFPLSIGIHKFLHLVEQTTLLGSDALGLLITHAIVGGVWWVGIATCIRMVFLRK